MAEAIAFYFSYAEPQYSKIAPAFVSPGPEAFFAHVARLESEYRAQTSKRRSVRLAGAESAETTADFAAFLDYLAAPSTNRLVDRALQALIIAERALAGYVFLLGKEDCEDWPRSHLVQPLTWFLKLLLPSTCDKILGSELKHVAELILGMDDRRPKKMFQVIEQIQAKQSFDDFRKLMA